MGLFTDSSRLLMKSAWYCCFLFWTNFLYNLFLCTLLYIFPLTFWVYSVLNFLHSSSNHGILCRDPDLRHNSNGTQTKNPSPKSPNLIQLLCEWCHNTYPNNPTQNHITYWGLLYKQPHYIYACKKMQVFSKPRQKWENDQQLLLQT